MSFAQLLYQVGQGGMVTRPLYFNLTIAIVPIDALGAIAVLMQNPVRAVAQERDQYHK